MRQQKNRIYPWLLLLRMGRRYLIKSKKEIIPGESRVAEMNLVENSFLLILSSFKDRKEYIFLTVALTDPIHWQEEILCVQT
jgi:hypothetical protein